MEDGLAGLQQSKPRLKAKSMSYDGVKKKEFHYFFDFVLSKGF